MGRLPRNIPHSLLDKYGMTVAQLMLNWVTYRDSVVAIPKASSASHVEEDASAVGKRISADDYRALSRMS
jgi:diketogulonate reductase-like aldo/keto reductase